MSIQQYDSHYRAELAASRKQQRTGSKSHAKTVDAGSLKQRLESAKMNYRKELEKGEIPQGESPDTSLPGTPDSGLRRSGRRRTQRVLVNIPPDIDQPLSAPPVLGRQPSLRSSHSSYYSNNGNVNVGVSGRKRRVSSVSSESASDLQPSSSAKSRKRKTTGNSRNSSGTQPATPNRSLGVAAREDSSVKCFICQKVLEGDMDAINEHIDGCLLHPLEDSPVSSGVASERDVAAVADEGPVIEYEWGGQTRVRATAMLEGGPSAAGLGFGSSGQMDRDEDVDVDAEDETNFGTAQYTDADLVFLGGPASSKNHVGAAPQWEETPLPLDTRKIAAAAHAADAARGVAGGSTGALQLVVDALKARIQEQDRLLRTVKKCTICLESYDQPCVSVNCWHVHCEKCWLHTLGSKKLCPQCLQITQPTDLRRIYM
ncbi:hypothetical protein LPJ75_001731 [Coemansia sp. RSA 2598]|nr:hypothetical protein LPJ75_001731 [Coemansia sp. RSA 2598]